MPHQGNCNPDQLPLRTNLRGDIRTAEIAGEQFKKRFGNRRLGSSYTHILTKDTGIVRQSILLYIRSVHFPRSFPIDVMHAILLNNVPLLYRIWSSEIELQGNHAIPSNDLAQIGSAMAKARAHVPTSLGRAPRDISKHFRSFKAAEWKGWLLYYGCPLLHTHLNAPYLANFRTLSKFFLLHSSLANFIGRIYYHTTQFKIQDIEKIRRLCSKFVRDFERLYYRKKQECLHVCRINIHSLLHLAQQIEVILSLKLSAPF